MRFIEGFLVVCLFATQGVAADGAADNSGEALFQNHCASCHDHAAPRMPSRADLAARDPRDVFTAVSAGLMAPYGRALSPAQRRAVAEYITGQSLGGFSSTADAIPKAAFCAARPTPVRDLANGWNGWGVDLANSRFQPAEKAGLGRDDVGKLKVKWAFGVPAVTTMSGQPTAVDGQLFFGTFSGLVIALDAQKGCANWVFEAQGGVRSAITLGRLRDGTTSVFFGDLSGRVYALDPDTGRARWSRAVDDHPHSRITGSPVYYGERLYVPLSSLEEVAGAMAGYECCTFRGGVVAVDAASGEEIWKTHSIAEAPSRRGKNKAGTQLWAPSGAAIWSAPTLDPATNTLYVTTGDSYSDPAAPESDAVMAMAMDSGKVRWVTQTTAGDAFTTGCMSEAEADRIGCPESAGPDLDFGSSPVLVTLGDGRRLLLAGQKSGWMHALNPGAGEIVWQTKVGDAGVVGGIEWGFAVDARRAYVAIAEAWEKAPDEAGGISALNLADGTIAWAAGPPQGTCAGRERCNTGQTAAVSAIPGVVFSGSLDGHLRAYDAATGEVIWDFDTRRDYVTVNTVPATGGSLNGPGPTIANGHVYVVSGYSLWNQWTPGNALIAFSVDGK